MKGWRPVVRFPGIEGVMKGTKQSQELPATQHKGDHTRIPEENMNGGSQHPLLRAPPPKKKKKKKEHPLQMGPTAGPRWMVLLRANSDSMIDLFL